MALPYLTLFIVLDVRVNGCINGSTVIGLWVAMTGISPYRLHLNKLASELPKRGETVDQCRKALEDRHYSQTGALSIIYEIKAYELTFTFNSDYK